MAEELNEDSGVGESEQFVDSDDESDNQPPELYWDSEDEEIILNPIQAQPTESQQDENDSLCDNFCMKEKIFVNILCGHAKWCI